MNSDYVFKYAEKKANSFNLYCLLIISGLGLIAVLLNEIGIFTCDKIIMRAGMIQLAVYGIVPGVIYLIHDKLLKKEESIF